MSNKERYEITPDQFMLLQGFMLYVWNVNHGDETSEYYSFWADQLDKAGVCWYVQNTAAYVMDKRENGWKYFRNLLQDKNIYIVEPKPQNLITAEYDEACPCDDKPFMVILSQNDKAFNQEYYDTETSAIDRTKEINSLYTSDRKMI